MDNCDKTKNKEVKITVFLIITLSKHNINIT